MEFLNLEDLMNRTVSQGPITISITEFVRLVSGHEGVLIEHYYRGEFRTKIGQVELIVSRSNRLTIRGKGITPNTSGQLPPHQFGEFVCHKVMVYSGENQKFATLSTHPQRQQFVFRLQRD